MKVRWERVFTDGELHKISTVVHRSTRANARLAKRAEVRVWIDGVVKRALADIADEVHRPAKVGVSHDIAVTVDVADNIKALGDDIIGAGGAADPMRRINVKPLLDTPCKCGKPKSEHQGAKLFCPLSKRTKPGAKYEAAD